MIIPSVIQTPRARLELLDNELRSWCLAHDAKPVLTDHVEANAVWSANAGPMSLAAALGFDNVEAVRSLVEPLRGSMSAKDMLDALRNAGVEVEVKKVIRRRTPWPLRGLVRIQWKGPWCEDPDPDRRRDERIAVREAHQHTHWVAVRHPPAEEAQALGLSNRELLVYDATPNRWVPMFVWSAWCPTLWPAETVDWFVASCFDLKLDGKREQ